MRHLINAEARSERPKMLSTARSSADDLLTRNTSSVHAINHGSTSTLCFEAVAT